MAEKPNTDAKIASESYKLDGYEGITLTVGGRVVTKIEKSKHGIRFFDYSVETEDGGPSIVDVSSKDGDVTWKSI